MHKAKLSWGWLAWLGLALVLAACDGGATPTPDINAKNLPKDRALFLSNRDGWPDLYTLDLTGKQVGRVTNTAEAEYGASWSPDGRRIVFTAVNGDQATGANQQHDIYVMDGDGNNRHLAVKDGFGPVWSPDGKRVLFTRTTPLGTSPSTVAAQATPTPDYAATHVVSTPAVTRSGSQLKFGLYTAGVDDTNSNGQLLVDGAVAGSWSPDGQRVAYLAGDNVINQKRSLNLINSDGSGRVALGEQIKVANLDVLYVAWSPDGSQLAFSAVDLDKDKMSLYRVSPAGGAPRRLGDYAGSGHEAIGLVWAYADFANPAPRLHLGPVWSPNSQQLAYTAGGNQLVMVSADTGNQRFFPIGSAALGQDSDSVLNVTWQSDNRHLLYDRAGVGRNALLQKAENYLYDFFDESLESLDTVNKNVQTLSNQGGSFLSPVCCGMDLLSVSQSDNSAKNTAKATTTPAANGRLVYTSGIGQRQLIVQDLQSGQRTVITGGAFHTLDFSLAPTGNHLAWLEGGDNFQSTIYIANQDGKQRRQLSSGSGTPDDLTMTVIWSPDGHSVAFQALNGDKNLAAGLYVFNGDGGDNAPRLVTKENVSAFTWSPDSRNLAYKVDRETYTLYIVPAANPPPYPAATARIGVASSRYASLERGLVWSPDGQYLAFGGGDDYGRFATWLYTSQGQTLSVSGPILGRLVGWTNDSTHLLAIGATSTQSTQVQVLDLQTGRGKWRSYDEGIGATFSGDSANLLFYTQHNLPSDYYFSNGGSHSASSQLLDEPYLSLVSLSNGLHLNDLKLKYPPYFGFKGRFYSWSPDSKALAYYENNSVYMMSADGKNIHVLAHAFALDRLAWIK